VAGEKVSGLDSTGPPLGSTRAIGSAGVAQMSRVVFAGMTRNSVLRHTQAKDAGSMTGRM